MTRVTKSILTLLVVLSGTCTAQTSVRIGAAVKDHVQLQAEGRTIAAELSVTAVQSRLPDGKIVDGSVISIYEPGSRLFWWTHQGSLTPANPTADKVAFLKSYQFELSGAAISCYVALGRSLWIRTSRTKAADWESGFQEALTALRVELPKFQSGELMWFEEVPLGGALDRAFFRPDQTGNPQVELRIGRISRASGNRVIEIVNDRGEIRQVQLGPDLRLLKTDR